MKHKHAELMMQYAQDAMETDKPWRLWEVDSYVGQWTNLVDHPGWLVTAKYRRKPQKKPVDLSVLIDSRIDCEFSNHPDFPNSSIYLGKLRKIRSVLNHYSLGGGIWYQYCRPRMDHCHYWQGGDCPLPDGFKVEVKLRGGNTGPDSLELLTWPWDSACSDQDIIAFKVVGLNEGYCWPWSDDVYQIWESIN